MSGEILVVPFHSPGHTFPATELSNHIASRGYHVTLFLPSSPSSSSSSPTHPLIKIVESSIPSPPLNNPTQQQPPSPPNGRHSSHFEDYLTKRSDRKRTAPAIICAIVDVMMSQLVETCRLYEIPVVSFFTASACASALDHAKGKFLTETRNMAPDDTLKVPGLPEDMALTVFELVHGDPLPPPPPASFGDYGHQPPFVPYNQHVHPPPPLGPDLRPGPHAPFQPMHHHRPIHHLGPFPPPPSGPGGGPSALGQADGAMALLFNTCDELERPFLDYIAKETNKPVWGVGPLLPAQFWSLAGLAVHDGVVRSTPDSSSSVSEVEVQEWLNTKPRGSVVYISFGTLVGPTEAELAELEAALGESTRPFIWVLQQRARKPDGSYFPDELARRTKGRGLVVQGWAPQLLILSHPSTAMFISHCGWNSTVEALRCGVPMLTWPIHGDQLHNAKLVTSRLRVGCAVKGSSDAAVMRNDVVKGIERLMRDEAIRDRVDAVRSIFDAGFPNTSTASLDHFLDAVR